MRRLGTAWEKTHSYDSRLAGNWIKLSPFHYQSLSKYNDATVVYLLEITLYFTAWSYYLNQCWNIFKWPVGTIFHKISINIHKFSFKKIHFKISSGKWRQTHPGLNGLISLSGACRLAAIVPRLVVNYLQFIDDRTSIDAINWCATTELIVPVMTAKLTCLID